MLKLSKTSQCILRGFLFFFVISIFISCSSLPLTDPLRTQPKSFAAVEMVLPNWQPYAHGIDFMHGRAAAPEIEFWALKIELAAPNLRIVVKGGADDTEGGTDNVLSVKVSSFVRTNGLAAGINAVPFNIASSKEGQPIINIGIVISDGKQIAPANSNYDALVFYNNGKAEIVNQSAIKSMGNIVNAVGGFHHILINGAGAERVLSQEGRKPRSAAGISADGEYLYLLVIDGRRARSAGSTERETALLLLALGAWNGINLDGGGSSAIALRNIDGKVRVVNTPIHGGFPGMERAVAGCLGIAANPSKGK